MDAKAWGGGWGWVSNLTVRISNFDSPLIVLISNHDLLFRRGMYSYAHHGSFLKNGAHSDVLIIYKMRQNDPIC